MLRKLGCTQSTVSKLSGKQFKFAASDGISVERFTGKILSAKVDEKEIRLNVEIDKVLGRDVREIRWSLIQSWHIPGDDQHAIFGHLELL